VAVEAQVAVFSHESVSKLPVEDEKILISHVFLVLRS
jgi:hypothetical protein